MSQPIDRRQFQKRLSAALATTALLPLGCATQGPGGFRDSGFVRKGNSGGRQRES